MQSTLVLNASFEPLSIVSAQRAITLITNGKAVSVDDSPRVFRSATDEINIPYVIRLNDYVKRSYNRRAVFSRRGVLVRDKFLCVYCGSKASTIDHVTPRFLGGGTSYENCVAACGRCNHKKGHKTLEDMGWTLKDSPKPPSAYALMLMRCPTNEDAKRSWVQHLAPWDVTLAA